MDRGITPKPEKKSLQWILWWRVDPEEIQDQGDRYQTMGWLDSARKLSVLCLLFSIVTTFLLILFKFTPWAGLFDVVLMMALAAFIYRGHRWAMIAAMLLWTLEKIGTVLAGLGTLGWATSGGAVVSVFWWCLYMHASYLAFRVEQLVIEAAPGFRVLAELFLGTFQPLS